MHTLIEKNFLNFFSENNNFNLVHAVINCKSKFKTLNGMDFKKEGKIENIKKNTFTFLNFKCRSSLPHG